MKLHKNFKYFILVDILISLSSLSIMAQNTSEIPPTEPLALQKIMADLGQAMQAVTKGISHEDWLLVETSAAQIAIHPQPPMSEKIRILGFMGSNISQFKAHDIKTHDSALELGKQAAKQDGAKVITAFAKLQQTCLDCHQRFRKPLRQHFYGIEK